MIVHAHIGIKTIATSHGDLAAHRFEFNPTLDKKSYEIEPCEHAKCVTMLLMTKLHALGSSL